MVLFRNKIAAECTHTGKTAGLGKNKGTILTVIRAEGAGAPCRKDIFHPGKTEVLLQPIQDPHEILRTKEVIAAETGAIYPVGFLRKVLEFVLQQRADGLGVIHAAAHLIAYHE